MTSEANAAERRPSWVTYIIRRDEDVREEIIVEEWEGSPPFGYMAGRRSLADGNVDYFGHTFPTAAECIEQLEYVPESIQAELIYYDRTGGDLTARRELVQCASEFPIFDREITNEDWEEGAED